MYTIDASVHINALNPAEDGSTISQACLQQLFEGDFPLLSPTLLVVEVAAAVSRVLADPELALELSSALWALPRQAWVPLDDALAADAARLAAEARLRGADAVYGAVARRFGATLVTRDGQQLSRLQSLVRVQTPEQLLAELS